MMACVVLRIRCCAYFSLVIRKENEFRTLLGVYGAQQKISVVTITEESLHRLDQNLGNIVSFCI